MKSYLPWLARVEKKLSKAMPSMQDAVNAANHHPKENDQTELHKLIVSITLKRLRRAHEEIRKAIRALKYMQYGLAANVNPKQRTHAEKKLVPQEPKSLEHDLLLGEKTHMIDSSFIRNAATILNKYRKKNGKPIARPEMIIAGIFKFAFGRTEAEDNIRRNLSPSRRNKVVTKLF